jgi:ABC-type transport system involved in multi-copper enzyme maturation permease subunit
MIKGAYIRLVWRNNRTFAIFSMAFITLFQFLLLYLVKTFDTAAMLSAVLAQMPPAMKAFLQDSFLSMLNYDGAAAFGFNHPIVLALLIIIAINIPVHQITRELESGALELLLSHPFRRNSLILSLMTSGAMILLAIIIISLSGSILSIILFHKLTSAIFLRLLLICLNLWLLVTLIFSYTLLIAVFCKIGVKAGNLSAAITLFFYLLSFLAELWDRMAFTKHFNIFTYYAPQKIMFHKGNLPLDLLVLGGLILICLVISLRRFGQRDIP